MRDRSSLILTAGMALAAGVKLGECNTNNFANPELHTSECPDAKRVEMQAVQRELRQAQAAVVEVCRFEENLRDPDRHSLCLNLMDQAETWDSYDAPTSVASYVLDFAANDLVKEVCEGQPYGEEECIGLTRDIRYMSALDPAGRASKRAMAK